MRLKSMFSSRYNRLEKPKRGGVRARSAFCSRARPKRPAVITLLAGLILVMGLTLHSNSPAAVDPNLALAMETPYPLPMEEIDGAAASVATARPVETIPLSITSSPTQKDAPNRPTAFAVQPTQRSAGVLTPGKTPAPIEGAAAAATAPGPTELSFLEAFAQDAKNRPTAIAVQPTPQPATLPTIENAVELPKVQRAARPTVEHITITTQPAPTLAPASAPLYTYNTADLRIEIQKILIKNVVYFAAEIWLTDASQLKSAFSSDRFDSAKETVKDIAKRNDAVLAVNGDFATFNNGGIIIRDGVLYRSNRSTRHLLLIDKNGDFIPYMNPPDNAEEAAAEFIRHGIRQTLVFGPLLVENGEAVPLPEKYFISTGMALEPRTAIGQIGPLHYLWIVVDGRQQGYSQGVSLPRLQELFLQHGVQTAFNLDGGGSTTLYYMGDVINKPANSGGRQRDVPDILFIAP